MVENPPTSRYFLDCRPAVVHTLYPYTPTASVKCQLSRCCIARRNLSDRRSSYSRPDMIAHGIFLEQAGKSRASSRGPVDAGGGMREETPPPQGSEAALIVFLKFWCEWCICVTKM